MFTVDKRQIEKLGKHFDKLQKRLPMSIAGMLNAQADGTRNTALEEIARTMTVRSRPFVAGRIRYTKAMPSSLEAIVGSVATDRFTGFAEQERGGEMERERGITLAARRGIKTKKVLSAARLKRTNVFEEPSKYEGKSAADRARGMIRALSRKGHRKPFIVHGHEKLPAGLYQLKGRRNKQKLVMMQRFGEAPKVERHPWMRPAIDLFFRRWYSKREWGFQFGRFAKRFK